MPTTINKLEQISDAVERVTRIRPVPTGANRIKCRCVDRSDAHASMEFVQEPDGKVNIFDGATFIGGDRYGSIFERLGLDPKAMHAKGKRSGGHRAISPKPDHYIPSDLGADGYKQTVVYQYFTADGVLAYEVVRYELTPAQYAARSEAWRRTHRQKAMRVRRPVLGGWDYSAKGGVLADGTEIPPVEWILYRLPKLLAADKSATVWFTEGEKDCDRLRSAGLVATCNPLGAGKFGLVSKQAKHHLRGRTVYVLEDNDPAGREHAQAVAQSLARHAAEVRVVRFPMLLSHGDVSDYLDTGNSPDDLMKLAAEAEVIDPRLDPDTGKPRLIVNRGHAELVGEALAILEARNDTKGDPDALYRGQTGLVQVCEGQVRAVGVDQLRLRLANVAECGTFNEERESFTSATPPEVLCRSILVSPRPPFPRLLEVWRQPGIREDGTYVPQPGYDAAAEVYLDLPTDLEVPSVPANPTHEDAQRAASDLMEGVAEFPFVADPDKANMLAAILTPTIRSLMGWGSAPACCFAASKQGTGKTLLAKYVSIIATGKVTGLTRWVRDEEERMKHATACIAAGERLLIYDNVNDLIASDTLNVLLTSPDFTPRLLGANGTGAVMRLRHRLTIYLTANNPQFDPDMARRVYFIALDARQSRPWERGGFKIADLEQWTHENRGRLLAAALTMARAWVISNRPVPANLPILGSFERWCGTIGGMLAYAGVQGFLENRHTALDATANPENEHGEFLSLWWERLEGRDTTAREVAQLFGTFTDPANRSGKQVEFATALPERVSRVLGRSAFVLELGRFLGRIKDNIADNGFVLRFVGKDRNKVSVWKVEYVGPGDPPPRHLFDKGEY